MRGVSSAVSHLGILLGPLCAIVGLAVQGPESAALWAVVGYFLGKTTQSTYWAIAGERTT